MPEQNKNRSISVHHTHGPHAIEPRSHKTRSRARVSPAPPLPSLRPASTPAPHPPAHFVIAEAQHQQPERPHLQRSFLSTHRPQTQATRVQRNQHKKAEKINLKTLSEKNKDFRRELEDKLRPEEKAARAVRCKGAVFTEVATQRRWQARY